MQRLDELTLVRFSGDAMIEPQIFEGVGSREDNE
jgi:hypothetical protein